MSKSLSKLGVNITVVERNFNAIFTMHTLYIALYIQTIKIYSIQFNIFFNMNGKISS